VFVKGLAFEGPGDPVIDRLFGSKAAESLYLIIFTVETPLVL